jgi:antitoxin PrlF
LALSYTTVLTRKGQTTIPADLRAMLGIKEGDRLVWWEEDGKLYVMGARQYAKRMSEAFRARRDPNQRELSIEELKEAAAETWTYRHDRAAVEQ